MFVGWVEYFAKLHKIVTVAVPPHYTSQDCAGCGNRVKKTLSTRSHQCLLCGLKLHRDHNSAKVILVKGLETLGLNKVPMGNRQLTPGERITSGQSKATLAG
jgi:putative transposase